MTAEQTVMAEPEEGYVLQRVVVSEACTDGRHTACDEFCSCHCHNWWNL